MEAGTNATRLPFASDKSPHYVGRIPRSSFEALIGGLYGFAIVTALIRLLMQLRSHRRLYLDDWLLIFAMASLSASTALAYLEVETLYWDQDFNYDNSRYIELIAAHVDVGAHENAYQRLAIVYSTLFWTSTFAVKFAFLAFFRRLVHCIKPLMRYWRFVVGITMIVFPVCVISIVFPCMKWGLDAVNCSKAVYQHRALDYAIMSAILDIGTDIMIVALPIQLVRSVRIQLRQKIILGIFLALNLFMAITACVRISGITFRGRFDEVWVFAWLHVEACVAVAMLSLSTFRSVFIGSESLQARKDLAKRQWYASKVRAMQRKKTAQKSDSEATVGMSAIPGVTLTSMRTFIQGRRNAHTPDQTKSCASTVSKADCDSLEVLGQFQDYQYTSGPCSPMPQTYLSSLRSDDRSSQTYLDDRLTNSDKKPQEI